MSESEYIEIFAGNLQDLMNHRGYTQATLAYDAGLSQSTISKYLNCQQMPSVKAIVNLVYTLDCSFEDLMDFGDIID